MTNWNERNRAVIAEFRANAGKVAGRELLLLTTRGRKTGREHVTPLMYIRDGQRYSVIASRGGDPNNPHWYKNLVANPRVRVEVGPDSFETDAIVADEAERERLFALQAARYPFFNEYQKKVERRIPVVILPRPAKQA
jgi:deazaflavin-dependent oxidoreductase (nitroreductase family)